MPKFYTKVAASEAINSKPTGNVSIPRIYNPDLVTHRSFNPEQGLGKAWGPNLADPTTNWDTTFRTPDNIHNTALVLLREEMTTKAWCEPNSLNKRSFDDRQFKYGVPFDMYVAQAGNTTNVGEINKTRAYYADENGDAVGGSLANEPYHVNGWQYVYYIVATTNLDAAGNDFGTAYFCYEIYAGWANLGIKSGDFLSGTEIDPVKVNSDDNYMSQQRGVNLLGLSIPPTVTTTNMAYPNNNQPYYGTGYKGTDPTYSTPLERAYRGVYRVSHGKIAMNFDSGANHEMNPSKSGQTFLTDVRFADFNQYGRPSSVIACNNKYMLKFNITSYTAVESSVIGNSEPFESCPKTLSLSQWVKFSDLITDYTNPEIYKFQFNPTGTRLYALGTNVVAYPNQNLGEDRLWRFNLGSPFDLSQLSGTIVEEKILSQQYGPWSLTSNGYRVSRLREPTNTNGGCGSLEFNPQFLRDSNTGSITDRTANCLVSFANWRDTVSGNTGSVYIGKSGIAQYDFTFQNSIANAKATAEGGVYTGNNFLEDQQLNGLVNNDRFGSSYASTSGGYANLVRSLNASYRYVRSGAEQDNNYSTSRTNPPCFYAENIDGSSGSEGISEMVFATARMPIHDSFNDWSGDNNQRFEVMLQKRKLPANNYIDGFTNDTLINTIDPMPVSNNTNSNTGNLDNADTLYASVGDKMTAANGSSLTEGVDFNAQVMTFGNEGYYAFLMCEDELSLDLGIRRIELAEPYDISTRTRNNEQFVSLSTLGLGHMLSGSTFGPNYFPFTMEFGQITDENTTDINEYGETLYIQCRGKQNEGWYPYFFTNDQSDGIRRDYRGDYVLALRFTTLWDLTSAYYYDIAGYDSFIPEWSWSACDIFRTQEFSNSNNKRRIKNVTGSGQFPTYGIDSSFQGPSRYDVPVNRMFFTNFQFFDNGYKVLLCLIIMNNNNGWIGTDTCDEYWVQLQLDFPYDLFSYKETSNGVAKHDTVEWRKLAGSDDDPLSRKHLFEVVYGRDFLLFDGQGDWTGDNKFAGPGEYGALQEQLTSYARFEDFCPSFIQLINNGRTLCKSGINGLTTFTNKKGTDWLNFDPNNGGEIVGEIPLKFVQQNRFGWTLSKQVKDRALLADKYRDYQQTLNFSSKSNLYLSKSSPGSSSYTADKGDESGPTTVNISFMMKHQSALQTELRARPTVVSQNGRFINVCTRGEYTFPKLFTQMTSGERANKAYRAYIRQLDLKKIVDT